MMDTNPIKDFDLDEDDEVIEALNPPKNFVKMGSAENDDTVIYIKQDVYNAIEKYSKDNVKKEVGSALVGDFGTVGERPAVIVDAFIEAKFTDSTSTALTFTPETWGYLYKELAARYPGKKIVGWHRTHPGEGATLSNYDMYIEENFFNSPYRTAYVIDPVTSQRGFYCWKNERIVKMKGFNMYDDDGKQINVARPTAKQSAPNAQKTSAAAHIPSQPQRTIHVKSGTSVPVVFSLGVIILLLIANLVSSIGSNMKFNTLIETLGNSNTQIEEQRIEAINKLADAISSSALTNPAANTDGDTKNDAQNGDSDANKPDDANVNTDTPDTTPTGNDVTVPDDTTPTDTTPSGNDETPTTPTDNTVVTPPTGTDENTSTTSDPETPPPADDNKVRNDEGLEFFPYKVKRGEYISLICSNLGIDYEKYYRDILKLSNIANADQIDVGQTIYLPLLPGVTVPES